MGNGLARISHPMPTYLIWNENQSYRSPANARRNKTHAKTLRRQKKLANGNRLPMVGLTSDSKQKIHQQETECQSLGLYHTPNNKQTGNRMPIVGLTSDSTQTNTQTGNRMPIAGLTLDSTPTHKRVSNRQANRESGTRA